MPLWDAPYCLQFCKDLARRPAVDQAMPDTRWYRFLTAAEPEVYTDLFSRFPDFAYSAPVLLTSTDGGFTYEWPDDADGDPVRPVGHAELYPSENAVPDSPLEAGVDFIFEGGLIRFPGARSRQFPNGPWSRFVAMPDVAIDATHDPQLQPKTARALLCMKACSYWASRPGSGARKGTYDDMYTERLNKEIMALATAYNSQGGQAAGASGDRIWWYSQDLG